MSTLSISPTRLKAHRTRPAARSIPRGRVSSCNRKFLILPMTPSSLAPAYLEHHLKPLGPFVHLLPLIISPPFARLPSFPSSSSLSAAATQLPVDGMLAKQSNLSRLKTVPQGLAYGDPGQSSSGGGQSSGSQSGNAITGPSKCGPSEPQATQYGVSCSAPQCQGSSIVRHPSLPFSSFNPNIMVDDVRSDLVFFPWQQTV